MSYQVHYPSVSTSSRVAKQTPRPRLQICAGPRIDLINERGVVVAEIKKDAFHSSWDKMEEIAAEYVKQGFAGAVKYQVKGRAKRDNSEKPEPPADLNDILDQLSPMPG